MPARPLQAPLAGSSAAQHRMQGVLMGAAEPRRVMLVRLPAAPLLHKSGRSGAHGGGGALSHGGVAGLWRHPLPGGGLRSATRTGPAGVSGQHRPTDRDTAHGHL